MDNNQQNAFQTQPNMQASNTQMSNNNQVSVLELVGLILAAVGLLVSFIFTICSCNASATNSAVSTLVQSSSYKFEDWFEGSFLVIGAIIGVIMAIAGIVLVFVAKAQQKKIGVIGKITILIAFIAILLGTVPNITICAYNCSLNGQVEDQMKKTISDNLSDYFN